MCVLIIKITLGCLSMLVFCGCQDDSSTLARNQTQHQTSRLSDDSSLRTGSDVVSGLESISLGDSSLHVISVLGSPTYEHSLMPKMRPAISRGRVLYYVTKQHEPGNLNSKIDSYAAIYLDETGNVREILRNNID